eukprot:7038731-Pyramimonas_sp.AAC.1
MRAHVDGILRAFSNLQSGPIDYDTLIPSSSLSLMRCAPHCRIVCSELIKPPYHLRKLLSRQFFTDAIAWPARAPYGLKPPSSVPKRRVTH